MANNTLLNIDMITNEALMELKNNLVFANAVTRVYDDRFGIEGAKIGDTLRLRMPTRWVGGEGPVLNVENTVEKFVTVTLDRQPHVGMSYTSKELALKMDDFNSRIIKPAVTNLANKVDSAGLELAKRVYAFVGTPTTSASSALVYGQAGALLSLQGAPVDGKRSAIIDPITQANLVDNLKGLFQSSDKIAEQYETGNMGIGLGFNFSVDQNVATHTFGSGVSDPVQVNGNSQSGSTLAIKGLVGVLNAGDMFTITGVNSVNPVSRVDTGNLQQFTVQKITTNPGSINIEISPAIIPPNVDGTPTQYQTVTAAPVNSAALTFLGTPGGTAKIGICFHKEAFVLVTANLYNPNGEGAKASVMSDSETGLSVRVVSQYNALTDQRASRLDMLFGWALVYPELAVKVISKTGW